MAGFITKLKTIKIGATRWVLSGELIYLTERGQRIVVPEGFDTDLVSTRWWARVFVQRAAGNHVEPAVVHDFLLKIAIENGESRGCADRMFLEAMKNNGVNKLVRYVAFAGVRLLSLYRGAW